MDIQTGVVRLEDGRQCSAPVDGCQPAGIAVSQNVKGLVFLAKMAAFCEES